MVAYAGRVRFLRGKSGAPTPDEADGGTVEDPVEVSGPGGTGSGEPVERARTPGKGRATPSRREAESRRRGPAAPPPRTQREAIKRMRGSKNERRKTAATRRERMMAGDQKYLLPRDRGKVKAYVRDIVDARRNVAGLFMPLAGVILLAIFIPNPAVQQYISILTTAMLITMIVEGILLGRLVNKKVAERYPDEQVRKVGLGFYALTRATQLRKLRVPKPRIARGEPIP